MRALLILFLMSSGLFAMDGGAQASPGKLDPFLQPQKIAFDYKVYVQKPKGRSLRLWLPFPMEDGDQKVLSYKVITKPNLKTGWSLSASDPYGNKMLYFDLPSSEIPAKTGLEISVRYQVERRPTGPIGISELKGRSDLDPGLYLSFNQWLKTNETIEKMGKVATGKAKSSSQKVRALYDHVFDIMAYNKDGKGWGQGDPIWACTAKRGNCTDFHSLYIAMARGLNIPARFEIGVPLPNHLNKGEIPGYHCWARVYDAEKGWIPIDASEAKKANARDQYFGQLPSDRIAFSAGRNLTLSPPQSGGGINYFIYPYAEVDGKPFEEVTKKFVFQRL
ncbi:MAG: transglutaminase domain-containing protein [Bdellovibrionaceae bacterium]|nr:transglutaminase domain-containing protein [Bdellovibrionales bacterium]MCB9083936.1 transglutaminase domain-containing protein [Pseudobdellovibrionaceae bacterium]